MGFGMDKRVYRFDNFSLDPVRGTVLGSNHQVVALRPKVFALLRHLREHPGRVLDRGALLEALWPGVIVTDDSLTQCISDLRRVLGERAPHILRTVPRRGYVLSAQVFRDSPAQDAAASELTPALSRPSQGTPRPDPAAERHDTLIVEPLESLDDDPASARLARVLTADLVAALIRFEDLRVVVGPDVGAAGGYGLRGEVRLSGKRVRATIRLGDLATGSMLWADQLDESLDDQVAVPATPIVVLAINIDRQVNQESLRRARHKPFEALNARDLCLLGRELHQRGPQADTRAALDMFARALELDPEYATAYAWQAFSVMRFVTHNWGDLDFPAERDRAVMLARRGVEIEPDSPICRVSLAFALMLRQRWDEAVVMARLALQAGRVADFGTRTWCCEVLAAAGHPEEAAQAVLEAMSLYPHCPQEPGPCSVGPCSWLVR